MTLEEKLRALADDMVWTEFAPDRKLEFLRAAAALALDHAADICNSATWNLDHAALTIHSLASTLRGQESGR